MSQLRQQLVEDCIPSKWVTVSALLSSVPRLPSLCAVEVVLGLMLDCVGLGSLVVAELPLFGPRPVTRGTSESSMWYPCDMRTENTV
jgi:hypothetical protein